MHFPPRTIVIFYSGKFTSWLGKASSYQSQLHWICISLPESRHHSNHNHICHKQWEHTQASHSSEEFHELHLEVCCCRELKNKGREKEKLHPTFFSFPDLHKTLLCNDLYLSSKLICLKYIINTSMLKINSLS